MTPDQIALLDPTQRASVVELVSGFALPSCSRLILAASTIPWIDVATRRYIAAKEALFREWTGDVTGLAKQFEKAFRREGSSGGTRWAVAYTLHQKDRFISYMHTMIRGSWVESSSTSTRHRKE